MKISNKEHLIRRYLEAIHFTEDGCDCGVTKNSQFHSLALLMASRDCLEFLNVLEQRLGEEISVYEYPSFAADIWFTRNGHGAGFWDGDWDEPFATIATDICKEMGCCDAYLGDDNLIHLSGE